MTNLEPIRPTIGQAFNVAAGLAAFRDYRAGLSVNTLSRHTSALRSFADHLIRVKVLSGETNAVGDRLASDPATWAGVTWGLIQAYQNWLLSLGFSINTVNGNTTIIKHYAALANSAGAIPDSEAGLIARNIRGIAPGKAYNINQQRETTRVGLKKSEANAITANQRRELLKLPSPDSPQGRRDAVMLRLLFVYMLRISEVLALSVSDIDSDTGLMQVFRVKRKKHQQLRLRGKALEAWQDYIATDKPLVPFPPSRKGGMIGVTATENMTRQAAFGVVRKYGAMIGVENLSPHDGRHTGTTLLAKAGTTPAKLRDARGDTKTSNMWQRYTEAAEVGNDEIDPDVFGDGK